MGAERGREATAEAMAWGWEHWDELEAMENPVGYLYRVGRSRSRRLFGRPPAMPPVLPDRLPSIEPALPRALARLSERQRVVVILVHSFDWAQTEVAELLGVSTETVHTHLKRGLRKLRTELGVPE